jgi:hypothetical protein
MPFILNEDTALKAALSGITVADSGNPARPVGVWFGQPDIEIRNQVYPYITIDLINVSIAQEREHRGYVKLSNTPEGADPTKEYMTDMPIPMNLDYQITTYARQPRHDRQIMYELSKNTRLPFRFGGLEIPEDGTLRRLDMLGFTKKDATEQNKRLFRNIYTVRVSSQLYVHELAEVYKVTESPNISFSSQDYAFETITQQ